MPAAFIYLKLPATEAPPDHGLEDRLDQALREAGAGTVLGWGSSLGDGPANRMRAMAFRRIDIEADDLDAARQLLLALLPGLGIPPGTELHYTRQRRPLQDIYQPTGWLQAQALPPH